MASCYLEWAQVGLKLAQVGSKLAQVGPKISSGRLQEALLKGPGRVQGGSWEALEAKRPPGGPKGAKMVSGWLQNDLKVTPACVQNH